MKLRRIGALALCAVLLALALAGCGGSKKPVILVVSFGTSYNDSREATIGAIEAAIQAANPGSEVRRAFTSQIIIDKLKSRDGLEIDNVEEAFARLVKDGVKKLIVQPTHVMSGFEYDDLMKIVDSNRSKFSSVNVGAPLLTTDADYNAVIEAITAATAEYDDGKTLIPYFAGFGDVMRVVVAEGIHAMSV